MRSWRSSASSCSRVRFGGELVVAGRRVELGRFARFRTLDLAGARGLRFCVRLVVEAFGDCGRVGARLSDRRYSSNSVASGRSKRGAETVAFVGKEKPRHTLLLVSDVHSERRGRVRRGASFYRRAVLLLTDVVGGERVPGARAGG